MRFVTQQFLTTIAANYSATSTQSIGALPFVVTACRVGFETGLTLAGPTAYQDWLARQATALNLSGGGRQYVSSNAIDLRAWYWMQRFKLGGGGRMYDLPSATSTIYFPLWFIFAPSPILPNGRMNKFALSPENYNTANPTIEAAAYNPSIAAGDPDLAFNVTWGANSAMQSAGTLTNTAATLVRLTFYGAILDNKSQAPTHYPIFGTDKQTPTGQSGLGWQYQIPTGFKYRRTMVMSIAGAGSADVRKSGYGTTAISEIAIKTFDGTPRLNMKFWDFMRDSQVFFNVADDNSDAPAGSLTQATSVTAEAANAGVGMVDWREQSRSKSPYGVSLVGKDLGADNFNFTTDTVTNASIVYGHDRYLPY